MACKPPAIDITREKYYAVLFDLDGVVAKTAKVHAASWKRLFDEFLESRAAGKGESWEPFDIGSDYNTYVDGKPRYDGVKSFLESRGIDLTYGSPDDPPDAETICGLGNRKNQIFNEHLETQGVEAYETAVEILRLLKEKGFQTAVVSSSKNCRAVLKAAGTEDLFDARVDGVVSEQLGLNGKPAPDIFLEAARRVGATPDRAVVIEDAISGVQAGRRGNFGCVVGVDRIGHAEALRENGADIVVSMLSELTVEGKLPIWEHNIENIPSALGSMDDIRRLLTAKRPFVALDYDGTLTPIVERPELAILSDEMRSAVTALTNQCTVAVISGRDLSDVKGLALTLGFARRFATYKRPSLLLHDPERLLRLLTNPQRPVQLIITGKAHPADSAGQALIQEWTHFIRRLEARPQVIFLSDYDMHLTKHLVQGVDDQYTTAALGGEWDKRHEGARQWRHQSLGIGRRVSRSLYA
jgi:trehalose 6-phosphate phosphatase